jgi:hypothetical protein
MPGRGAWMFRDKYSLVAERNRSVSALNPVVGLVRLSTHAMLRA